MNVLFDEVFRPLEQFSCQDDGRRRAVPCFLVLGLRDLDEHLRSGVLDVDLLEDRHAIVRDDDRSEEHTSELQSQSNLVCRLLLEKNISNSCVVAICYVESCCVEGRGG